MLKPIDFSKVIDLKVVEQFDYACKKVLEANEHLRVPWEFIKNHERRQLTLQKLSHQVQVFETGLRRGQKTAYNRYQLIAAHAQLFVKLAIQHKDESVQSEADRDLEQVRGRAVRDVQEMGILKEVPRKGSNGTPVDKV